MDPLRSKDELAQALSDKHHAYLVLGEREDTSRLLLEKLEESGILEPHSPDLFLFQDESFGIGDARRLALQAQGKPLSDRKIFIISPRRFSIESQNALLKTLEEPYPDTHFFIIARDEESIIPTLLSRVRTVRAPSSKTFENSEVKKFLELSPAKRADFAKKFADNTGDLPVFLDQLTLHLKSAGGRDRDIHNVYKIRKFAADASAAPRLILEHLALML